MSRCPELLMLDLDGTVYQDGQALPGAIDALQRLARAGVEVQFLTNTTTVPRSAILDRLAGMGLEPEPDQVRTPLCFARDRLLELGLTRVRALVRPAAVEDLAGLELIPADARADGVQAVLVGDLGRHWTYPPLDAAFGDLMGGAAFFSCQANRYYRKGDRLVLDAGAFVAALEYAAERPAILVGKPSAEFFLAGARKRWTQAADLRARLDAGAIWMVGDDLEHDVMAARQAGLRGVLVRTGKFRPENEGRAREHADDILNSIAGLPSFLGLGTSDATS